MIVCHRYKFIFLKTRKTAGTSIEIALARFCGPDDIITPITSEDEVIRKELGHRAPQNYRVPRMEYGVKDWVDLILRKRRAGYRYYNHMPAEQIRPLTGVWMWNEYFKFCIERNPWDKAISLYFWWNRRRTRCPSLLEFLRSVKANRLSNYGIYGIDGEIAVNHVGRYEDLDAELRRIAAVLKLPEEIRLPRAKGNVRECRRHYRDVMGPEEREIITRVCAREIAHLSYSF